MKAALIALFLLGGGAMARAEETAPPPPPPACSLAEVASLDMRTLPDGEFTIPVTVDGRILQFLFDTGSDGTSISSETADEIGYQRGFTLGGQFLNGIPVLQFVHASDFRLGNLRSDTAGWDLLVSPNVLFSDTVHGLLGADFVFSNDVEIDFYRSKFNLFLHNKCDGRVVYWTRDPVAAVPLDIDSSHHIKFDAWLDGKAVTVALDTGSFTSFMSIKAARELFGWKDDDARLKRAGSHSINGKETPYFTYPFGTVSLEGIAVYNPQILLLPEGSFPKGHADDTMVVLGISVLRQLHIYIDYQGKMLYLTSAEAH